VGEERLALPVRLERQEVGVRVLHELAPARGRDERGSGQKPGDHHRKTHRRWIGPGRKRRSPSVEGGRCYSHSIVAGGFDEMSYTTRFTPGISLMTRLEIASSTSYGIRAQSAVMASSEVTARMTTGYA